MSRPVWKIKVRVSPKGRMGLDSREHVVKAGRGSYSRKNKFTIPIDEETVLK